MRATFGVAFLHVNAQADWLTYLGAMTNNDIQAQISRQSGVPEPTLTRWKGGSSPKPSDVVKIARAYDANPVLALIGAGILDAADVDLDAMTPRLLQLREFTSLELAKEIVRRIEEGEDIDLEEPLTVDRDNWAPQPHAIVGRRLQAVPTENEALELGAVADTGVKEVPEHDEGPDEGV